MRGASDEYAAARWVDDVVPDDALVMAELRAAAPFERPFVSWEYARFLAMASLPDANKAARLRRLAACAGVTHVAMRSPTPASARSRRSTTDVPLWWRAPSSSDGRLETPGAAAGPTN
jgi:hypothetical protein